MPLADSFSKPECVWLDGRRVLLVGPSPDDSSVVIVYVCGEEQRLPASTRFKREPPARKQQKRSGVTDSCDLEQRIWKFSSKLERECLARLAILNGTNIPDRYQDIRIATEAHVSRLLERQGRRRKKQPAATLPEKVTEQEQHLLNLLIDELLKKIWADAACRGHRR